MQIIDISIVDSSLHKLLIVLLVPYLVGCTNSLEIINSEAAYNTRNLHFSQAVVYKDVLYGSGQVGWDTDHQLTGNGTFADQFDQTIRNIDAILKVVGSDLQDVIHYRFFIPALADNHKQYISQFLSFRYTGAYQPATSIIGINALARPELLIEIEFIAKVNNSK